MANGISRQVYIISDLHLGGVYPQNSDPEDRGFRICTQGERVAEFVEAVAARPAGGPRTELVINGDAVDFLAEREEAAPYWTPFTADQGAAAGKLSAIVSRDRRLFDALGSLLENGHRLTILLGNHDIELALPQVRQKLRELLGVTGRHDYEFIHDGEAYPVGDVLIEHGNRYDSFNVVSQDALRRIRSLLSRNQPVPAQYAFDPPAGSKMVSTVINPIKEVYRFVDLLKPETGAVVPMLLALEPGYRNILSRVATLALAANKHRLAAPAMPSFGGDISSEATALSGFGGDMSGGSAAFGGDISSSAAGAAGGADPLSQVLAEALGESPQGFLSALEPEPTAYATAAIGEDISSFSAVDQTFGLMQLLLSRGGGAVERRLPALLKALRAVQSDRSFDRGVETAREYLDAARDLAKGGFRCVVFGHTHLAKKIDLGGGAWYLNSGTWADLIQFPVELLAGPEPEALARVRELVDDLQHGRLKRWTRFKPTYVRLDLGPDDRMIAAELCDYDGPQGI
jgi:UDP-2,3-diacylglucosamine pyrophosphatase LpxH